MKILGIDPGVSTGLSVASYDPKTGMFKVLELCEVPYTSLLPGLDRLLNKYQDISCVVYETWVHFTTDRSRNTTVTCIACGEIRGWAHCKQIPYSSIQPGSHRWPSRRWPHFARYTSHSGAALRNIVFHLYHNMKFHKMEVEEDGV